MYYIRIELLSGLCLGSGEGNAGIVDVDVLYDEYGIPYIPAKRLKGCLRQQAVDMSLLNKLEYPISIVNELFGDPGNDCNNGEIYLDNGYIKDYKNIYEFINNCSKNERYRNLFSRDYIIKYYTNIKEQTSIDRKTGASKRNTLRKIRTINSGIIFNVPIKFDIKNNYEKKINLLKVVCKTLRNIGLSRTRGLGEIRCELKDDINIENHKVDKIKSNNIQIDKNKKCVLKYTIELLSDLMVSNTEGSANKSSGYIPGNNLLGYFASRYINKYNIPNAEDDAAFRRLFLSENVFFLNAYLYDNGKKYFPAPNTIIKQKDENKYFDIAYEPDYKEIKEGRAQTTTLYGNYYNLSGSYINILKPNFRLHYHHRRPYDKSLGHAIKKEGEFFNYYSLSKGEKFLGEIIGNYNDLEIIEELVPDDSIIMLGKSKSAEYSKVKITIGDIQNFDECINDDNNKIIITLISPMILCNNFGHIDSDPKIFIKIIEDKYPQLKYIDHFVKYVTVYGFNSKWGLPKQQVTALSPGSVFVFEKCVEDMNLNDITENSYGLRKNEGFGRIDINTHGFNSIEQDERKEDLTNFKVNNVPKEVKFLLKFIQKEKLKKEIITRVIKDAMELQSMTNSSIGRALSILNSTKNESKFKTVLESSVKNKEKKNVLLNYLKKVNFKDEIIDSSELNRIYRDLNISYIEGDEIIDKLFVYFMNTLLNTVKISKRKKVGGKYVD